MAITAILSSLIGFVFMFGVLAKSQKYFTARQVELGNLNGHIEEVYSGLNVVKAYNGKYAADKNVKFETYASLRIRGSILDQIRKMDWIPRTLRQKQKRMDAAAVKLEAAYGRPASDAEIAEELGISRDEYEGWRSEAEFTNMVSLDDYLEQGSEGRMESLGAQFQQPENAVQRQELKEMLVEALQKLTENEQKVITLYYYEELTLKEISQILSVSESRVSQLHTKALHKIKDRLGDSVDLLNLF